MVLLFTVQRAESTRRGPYLIKPHPTCRVKMLNPKGLRYGPHARVPLRRKNPGQFPSRGLVVLVFKEGIDHERAGETPQPCVSGYGFPTCVIRQSPHEDYRGRNNRADLHEEG